VNAKAWSLIPALDVATLDEALPVVEALGRHPFVHGFKLGFSLGLSAGLPAAVAALRRHTDKPAIYDHQKAATDIPSTGALFAEVMASAGVEEVILFPQAGPATLAAWVEALHARGRKVIVGAAMTHPAYLASEGGWLLDDAPPRMLRAAADAGVRAFVLPLTKPEVAERSLAAAGLCGELEYYSPGYGSQGGDPARFGFVRRHHLIVGRALLAAPDPVAWVERARAALEACP
jgi:orotidine-5'-phosphate decarboxylase